MKVTRALGVCSQEECDDFNRGVLLLNQGNEYWCPKCRFRGWIEEERRYDLAPVDAIDPIYKTVKIHFNFNPAERRYQSIAVVSVPELAYGWTYEWYQPLVKTEKRALLLGESTLCALNSGDRSGEMKELVLRFDEGDFTEQARRLEEIIEDRDRRVYAKRDTD